jgi:hypothetical protein
LPLFDSHEQEPKAKQELENVHPVCRFAARAGFGSARDRKHDRANDANTDPPAKYECRAANPAAL